MITQRQLARDLGIDDKTLHKAIVELGITPTPAGQRRLLADGDVERIRAHIAPLKAGTTGAAGQVDALVRKIDDLERRVNALERQQPALRLGTSRLPVRPPDSPVSVSSSPPASVLPDVDLPAGTVALAAFAVAHGVNARSANEQVHAGRYAAATRQSRTRADQTSWYLTPEQQAGAVEWWAQHSITFHRCADCPHESK